MSKVYLFFRFGEMFSFLLFLMLYGEDEICAEKKTRGYSCVFVILSTSVICKEYSFREETDEILKNFPRVSYFNARSEKRKIKRKRNCRLE